MITFADFLAMSVPAVATVATNAKIKGVPLIDNVITYKSAKGSSQVYQATIDDHYINVYKDGVQTGETQRVIDLWVYPETDKAFFKNAKGEEAAYVPNSKVKEYLDLQLKKVPFLSFELADLSADSIRTALADFIKGLSHMGCKVSEVKDDNKKVVGYKTCMVKLRLVELADGKYGLKVLKSFFKKG